MESFSDAKRGCPRSVATVLVVSTPVFPSTGLKVLSAILSTNTLLLAIQNDGATNVPLSAISIMGLNVSSANYYTVASFVVLSNNKTVQLGQQLEQYQ